MSTQLAVHPKELLAEGEFESLVDKLHQDYPQDSREFCERIQLAGLEFVATAAKYRGRELTPSPLVDRGWHNLILHTRLYARLCEQLGVFVHHTPRPDRTGGGEARNPSVLAGTAALLHTAGFKIDTELWMTATGCNTDGACSGNTCGSHA